MGNITIHQDCVQQPVQDWRHRDAIGFIGVLKALTVDGKPHIRPLLCDRDLEIAFVSTFADAIENVYPINAFDNFLQLITGRCSKCITLQEGFYSGSQNT